VHCIALQCTASHCNTLSIQTTEPSILPIFQQKTPLFHLYSSPSIKRGPHSEAAPMLPPIQPSCLYSSPSFQPFIPPLFKQRSNLFYRNSNKKPLYSTSIPAPLSTDTRIQKRPLFSLPSSPHASTPAIHSSPLFYLYSDIRALYSTFILPLF